MKTADDIAAIAAIEDVIASLSSFLKGQLGGTGSVAFLPLWLKEAREVERDWPRAIEFGVACVAETHDAWIASAAAAVSVCSGDRLAWVAERDDNGITWLTSAENRIMRTAAVVNAARLRRLRTSDLLPMHRPKAYGGFVMVFTIGMRIDELADPVSKIEISVNNRKTVARLS